MPWMRGGEKNGKKRRGIEKRKRSVASASLLLGLDFLHHMSFVNV
jgi:hypothetical protein